MRCGIRGRVTHYGKIRHCDLEWGHDGTVHQSGGLTFLDAYLTPLDESAEHLARQAAMKGSLALGRCQAIVWSTNQRCRRLASHTERRGQIEVRLCKRCLFRRKSRSRSKGHA